MNALQNQYVELLKLTRSYLLQEYHLNNRLLAESETYLYFRNFVVKKNISSAPQSTMPIPSETMPTQNLNSATYIKSLPSQPQKVSQVLPVSSSAKNEEPPKVVRFKQELGKEALPTQSLSTVAASSSPPPSLPVAAETEVRKKMPFVPDLLPPVEAVDVSEIRKIILEKHPSMRFYENIPSDIEAKKKGRSWEQDKLVHVLIFMSKDLHYHQFLENLNFALEAYGWKSKIIIINETEMEKNKGWSATLAFKNLRLIIATEGNIAASAELKKLCQECPETTSIKHTLGGIPLLLLADLADYIVEPRRKQALWQTLKTQLAFS